VIARAVLCPSPPLLARELTGRAVVLPELREACAAAVGRLVKADFEVVVVVGPGAATRVWDPDSRLDLSAYAPVPAGQPGAASGVRMPRLPLALGLGAMLLDDAGYAGPRRLQEVAEAAPSSACLRLGALLAESVSRIGLLVVGDGSARRAPSAPGHFDERAAPFDESVEHAIADGDMAALAALDPALARELMATGRAAWQVLAGALGGGHSGGGHLWGGHLASGRPASEILYADDPFGVAYLVAVLDST
jgi:hypothetical protein